MLPGLQFICIPQFIFIRLHSDGSVITVQINAAIAGATRVSLQ